ncbi:MAG: thiamine ABC transporter substrate-binding protein [Rhodoferax sp.]|nr:thiamine ABC transporter substrate-binding protein [Rhodoferax sp.]
MRYFTWSRRWTLAVLVLALVPWQLAWSAELRLLTHASFSLPKPLLQQFEKEAGIKLRVTKAGDAGEMLNKLILTRANPIADVVFGIDNALAAKALAGQVLSPYAGPATQRRTATPLPAPLVPIDYGFVLLNYDKAWFKKTGLALPTSLDDLTLPAYAKLLVVQNPNTSSPGYAFLLATIGGMGEQRAFEWWGRMRANGLKVARGWSEAYTTEFSHNGGKHPLVVSYASSPAAEVFYAKTPASDAPTAALPLPGGVFRQIEGVALVQGGRERVAAEKLIEFLRSAPVQEQLQTEMWMFPVESGVKRAPVMKFAAEPTAHDQPAQAELASKGATWLARWTQVVLK